MTEGDTQERFDSIIQNLLETQGPGDGEPLDDASTVDEMYLYAQWRFKLPLKHCRRTFIRPLMRRGRMSRRGGPTNDRVDDAPEDSESQGLEQGQQTYSIPADEALVRRVASNNGPDSMSMDYYNHTSDGCMSRTTAELRNKRGIRSNMNGNLLPKNEYRSEIFNSSKGLELLLLLNVMCFPSGYDSLQSTILGQTAQETGQQDSKNILESVESSLQEVFKVLRFIPRLRTGADNSGITTSGSSVCVLAYDQHKLQRHNFTSLTELTRAPAVHRAAVAFRDAMDRGARVTIKREPYHDANGNLQHRCTIDGQDVYAVLSALRSSVHAGFLHRTLDGKRAEASRLGCKHIAVTDGLTFIATNLGAEHVAGSFDDHYELELTQGAGALKLLQYFVNTTLEDARVRRSMEIVFLLGRQFYQDREMSRENAEEFRRILEENLTDLKFHSEGYSDDSESDDSE